MEQSRAPKVASMSQFLAFLGYVIGAGLVVLGAISFGFQLLLMPLGLALMVLAAGRREPRLSGGFAGGSIGIAVASWLSYSLGLAETIFLPDLRVLVASIGSLALAGYLVGRAVELTRSRRAPSSPRGSSPRPA